MKKYFSISMAICEFCAATNSFNSLTSPCKASIFSSCASWDVGSGWSAVAFKVPGSAFSHWTYFTFKMKIFNFVTNY